jgi:hypothetical protein
VFDLEIPFVLENAVKEASITDSDFGHVNTGDAPPGRRRCQAS